jgi:dynein heavy chain 2
LEVISSLPDVDAPYLFALPDNIERSVQRVTSSNVVATLKSMVSIAALAGDFDREAWSSRIGPLADAWEKFVSSRRSIDVIQRLAADKDPVGSFIYVEVAFARKLMDTVTKDILSLRMVINGAGLLSSKVLQIGAALVQNTVPDQWVSDWDGPEQPVAWVQALMQRYDALLLWCSNWLAGSLLKSAICLSDLFRPATFLNALRQRTARSMNASAPSAIGLDKLKLVSSWSNEHFSKLESLRISGLYIQGAGFDAVRNCLVDLQSDASELQALPDVFVAWVPIEYPEPIPATQSLTVALYQGLDRSRIITDLSIPATTDKAKWVLAGVALFLDAQ